MSESMLRNSKPEAIKMHKGFFVKMRRDGYSDWLNPSFFRELIQNSVDAGSKNIDFRIGTVPAEGAFGERSPLDNVIRVICTDDGCGMTEDIIKNVFLKPGASSKDGQPDSIGGFGTARGMLCWSQARYSFLTNGLYVEGDGDLYTMRPVAEEIALRQEWVSTLTDAGRTEDAERVRRSIADLVANQNIRGTRFTIDIDPTETSGGYRVTEERVEYSLRSMLSKSQLGPKITLNGEALKEQLKVGHFRRKLAVQDPNTGADVNFAKVHITDGDKATYKGEVLVRVRGVNMYQKYISSGQQVVVEIEPALSKLVLREDRGGMKAPFDAAFDFFITELNADHASALRAEEESKHIVVTGALGEQEVVINKPKVDGEVDEETIRVGRKAQQSETSAIRSASDVVFSQETAVMTETEQSEHNRIVAGILDFVQAVQNGQETFLSKLPKEFEDEAKAAISVLRKEGADGLRSLSIAINTMLFTELRQRILQAQPQSRDILPDLHMHIESKIEGPDDRFGQAVRRLNPNTWRTSDGPNGSKVGGRGSEAHALYAGWTTLVRLCVEEMAKICPSLASEADGRIKIATGWHLEKPTNTWDYDTQSYQDRMRLASHKKLGEKHVFLLNPLRPDFKRAYDPTLFEEDLAEGAPKGVPTLLSLAIHETVHMVEKHHNERFASLLTRLQSAFASSKMLRKVEDEVSKAVAVVAAAYGKGKVRVQAMEGAEPAATVSAEPARRRPGRPRKHPLPEQAPVKGEPEVIRPAAQVLAHAAPMAMMVTGALASPENQENPAYTAAIEAVSEVLSGQEDGTVVVDCDRLAEFERGVNMAIEHDFMPEISRPVEFDVSQIDITGLENSPVLAQEFGAIPDSISNIIGDIDLPDIPNFQSTGLDTQPVSGAAMASLDEIQSVLGDLPDLDFPVIPDPAALPASADLPNLSGLIPDEILASPTGSASIEALLPERMGIGMFDDGEEPEIPMKLGPSM